MIYLLVALAAVPSGLAAQTPAPTPTAPPPTSTAAQPAPIKMRQHYIGFGFFATLGANWQMEGIEVGYVRRLQRGPAAVSFSGRVATFINESTMLGGTRGIVFGGTLAARTRMRSIAQFGEEDRGTGIGFDLTLELTGYTASGSPMSQGSRWLAVSALPAFSIGSGDAPHFGIVIGPTLFLTDGKPMMRGLLAFRGEAPLARREQRP